MGARVRLWLFVLVLAAGALGGCTPDPTPTPTPAPSPWAAVVAWATYTPYPTYTSVPTYTPLPTHTPEPTATDTPVPTDTPPPTMPPTLTRTATPQATATRRSTPTPKPTWTKAVSPVPTRTPTPAAPTHKSNIGPYLLMNPEAGQPTHNLLRNGPMRAYIAINPAHWTPADQLPNMEGYGRNWIPEDEELAYINAGAEGAGRYYDRFAPTYDATRANIHAWMSTWAFRWDDAAFAERWVAFQREWLRLMHANGYRAGVGGMKTHPFADGEILRLAPAIADSDYVFLSEAGAPLMMDGRGYSVLLYRDLYADLVAHLGADKVPPLILDVCVDGRVNAELDRTGGPWWQRGYRDFDVSRDEYMASIREYDLETVKDAYVCHVFWFATNVTKDTQSFDVNTDMLAVAEGWHQ